MKKFENPFRVLLELSRVGQNVISARVSTSLRLCPFDADVVSGLCLSELLSDTVDARRLFNGTYFVFSRNSNDPLTVQFIPNRSAKIEFNASLELEDGRVHDVHISLVQAPDVRRDYTVNDIRSIVLSGSVCIEVDDDETPEV